ncbi:MAG: hypothetical protein KBT06_06645 [Prevotellaceae bacterium]|nr:hypothetical protein [Candidatus Colivivens equi]
MSNYIRTLIVTILLISINIVAEGQCKIEYFWDTDPGVGQGVVIGETSKSSDEFNISIDASGLTEGIHTLGLRAINDGAFSSTYYRQFYIPTLKQNANTIEYFWDTDPGVGKGMIIGKTSKSSDDFSISLDASGLTEGIHTLGLRAINDGAFSSTYYRQFAILASKRNIKAIEYFFDKDPGVGKGTKMPASSNVDTLFMAVDIPVSKLSDGIHTIGLRTLTENTWSETKVRQFLINHTPDNEITAIEYYINDDPGVGKAHEIDIIPGKEITVETEIDLSAIPEGDVTLGLRARSGKDIWSSTHIESDIKWEGWDALQEYILSLEDTYDTFVGNTYTRQFKNLEWQSLYVPFEWDYSEWHNKFDVARINAFYQYDDDEDGIVDRQILEAISVKSGRLKANYPYLIRAKSCDTYNMPISNVITSEKENSYSCSTMEARYTFTGNYTNKRGLHSAGCYIMRGGQLVLASNDDDVLPPYRWYLTIENLGDQVIHDASSSIKIRVVGENEADVIENIISSDSVIEGIYNLNGQRLSDSLQPMNKGLFIVNGQKVLIK